MPWPVFSICLLRLAILTVGKPFGEALLLSVVAFGKILDRRFLRRQHHLI